MDHLQMLEEYNKRDDVITYLAYSGMLQWTQACIEQAARLADKYRKDHEATARIETPNFMSAAAQTADRTQFHTQCHFFAIAAYKVIEHKKWTRRRGIFRNVNFSPLKEFRELDVKDVRDMGEHRVEYFSGKGDRRHRWVKVTKESISDASGIIGTSLGGRLDWQKFAVACQTILPSLLAEPVPYPKSFPDWIIERRKATGYDASPSK